MLLKLFWYVFFNKIHRIILTHGLKKFKIIIINVFNTVTHIVTLIKYVFKKWGVISTSHTNRPTPYPSVEFKRYKCFFYFNYQSHAIEIRKKKHISNHSIVNVLFKIVIISNSKASNYHRFKMTEFNSTKIYASRILKIVYF